MQANANVRQKLAQVTEVLLNITEVAKMVLTLFFWEYATWKKDVSEVNTKSG